MVDSFYLVDELFMFNLDFKLSACGCGDYYVFDWDHYPIDVRPPLNA